jgi:hypothetical protein
MYSRRQSAAEMGAPIQWPPLFVVRSFPFFLPFFFPPFFPFFPISFFLISSRFVCSSFPVPFFFVRLWMVLIDDGWCRKARRRTTRRF